MILNRFSKACLILLISLLLISCATLKEKWEKATEDERARVVLFGFQQTLDSAFNSGLAYVAAHPEKQMDWKTKIIPMFDATNKILRELMIQGATGQKLTVLSVALAVVARLVEIEAALAGWGIEMKWKSYLLPEEILFIKGGLA